MNLKNALLPKRNPEEKQPTIKRKIKKTVPKIAPTSTPLSPDIREIIYAPIKHPSVIITYVIGMIAFWVMRSSNDKIKDATHTITRVMTIAATKPMASNLINDILSFDLAIRETDKKLPPVVER